MCYFSDPAHRLLQSDGGRPDGVVAGRGSPPSGGHKMSKRSEKEQGAREVRCLKTGPFERLVGCTNIRKAGAVDTGQVGQE